MGGVLLNEAVLTEVLQLTLIIIDDRPQSDIRLNSPANTEDDRRKFVFRIRDDRQWQ